jgi:hypothetical protein
LIIDDFDNSKGTGFCNASLIKSKDGKLLVNVRHVEYTLYLCHKFQSKYEGPLSYYHRDNDLALRTNNYLCELDPSTLEIIKWKRVEFLPSETKWNFVGLEDARLVHWGGDSLYLCGVRRDTNTKGSGRMELSEVDPETCKEISRFRIESPDEQNSYCEKNWMPIEDRQYHFIRWTNPLEVVKGSEIVVTGKFIHGFPHEIRGGTPLIVWSDTEYISIVHECKFTPKNHLGHKDSVYLHRFIVWDRQTFQVKRITQTFDFMTGLVEFCIGMVIVDDSVIITFGFYDNICYAIKESKKCIEELIWKTLKASYQNS